MQKLLSLVLALVCAGCAAVEFTPYEGTSQWRTASGSFVNRKHGMPIYDGLPPRPYRVIGFISTSVGDGFLRESTDAAAVRVARERQADALVLLTKGKELAGVAGVTNVLPTGYSLTATSFSAPSYLKLATYVAIVWQ